MRHQGYIGIGLLCAAAGLAHGQVGVLVSELVASTSTSGGGYGHDVDILGDQVIVGSPGTEAAFVFDITDSGSPSQLYMLEPSVAYEDEEMWFGTSVCLSSSLFVVGTDIATEAFDPESAVYFFDSSDGSLDHRDGRLVYSDIGNSLAANGDIVVSGAPKADGVDKYRGPGAVVRFDTSSSYSNTDLAAPYSYPDKDHFGWSVAISDSYILAGGPSNFDPKILLGETQLYSFSGTPLYTLTASDEAAGDEFGWSVALSEEYDIAAVGTPQAHVGGNDNGAVYLYDATDGSQDYKLTAGTSSSNDYFGYSTAISGNYIAIGAPGYDTSGTGGAVYIFDISTGSEVGFITEDTLGISGQVNHFGQSVAMDGYYLVVGSGGRYWDAAPSLGGRAFLIDIRCNEADFAAPYGSMNYLDYSTFFEAYAAQDPDADLAGNTDGSPDGNWNYADISAFLALYSAGCD